MSCPRPLRTVATHHCHFESAFIGCDGFVEVQVTQQHVCTHTATRLSADAGHHTLQSNPPPPQDPSPCAGGAVMAKSIEWAATPARTHGQREGEPNRVIRHVGLVAKAKPLPGHPWDRNKAFAGSVSRGRCASLCGASPRVHRSRVANQHHIPSRILPLRSLRASLLRPCLTRIEVQTQRSPIREQSP